MRKTMSSLPVSMMVLGALLLAQPSSAYTAPSVVQGRVAALDSYLGSTTAFQPLEAGIINISLSSGKTYTIVPYVDLSFDSIMGGAFILWMVQPTMSGSNGWARAIIFDLDDLDDFSTCAAELLGIAGQALSTSNSVGEIQACLESIDDGTNNASGFVDYLDDGGELEIPECVADVLADAGATVVVNVNAWNMISTNNFQAGTLTTTDLQRIVTFQ